MVLYEGFPANSCSWQPKENIENTKHLKDFEAKEEKSVQQASKKSKRAEMQQTRANKKEAAAVAIKVEAPEPTSCVTAMSPHGGDHGYHHHDVQAVQDIHHPCHRRG